MPLVTRVIREGSRLRVLEALLNGGESSWSRLLEETKLSRTTLSKTLQELTKENAIQETIRRSGERGRPSVLYSISRKSRGPTQSMQEVLSEFKKIEELANEFTELKKLEAAEKVKDIEKLSLEYMEFVTDLALVVIEKALLADFGQDARNSLVGNEALDSARRILWNNNFIKNSRDAIKSEMKTDSEEMLSKRVKELEVLKKKFRTE